MTKFKLTSHQGNDKIPAQIQATDAKGDLVCIIFVDGRLAPQAVAEDFSIMELEHFILIAKKFVTFFDILEESAAKDEIIKDREAIIRQLETENESLILTTPI